MYRKIEQYLVFNKKRNKNITTPCCNKSNKDLKFVTYKNYPNNFGYCHSCGKTNLPPAIYVDDFGNEYYWDTVFKKFEKVLQLYNKKVLHNIAIPNVNGIANPNKKIKFIDFKVVTCCLANLSENNLLAYLRTMYCNKKVDVIKKCISLVLQMMEELFFGTLIKN